MPRPARSATDNSHTPAETSVPAVSVMPAGTSEIRTIEMVSDPSVSVVDVEISSAIVCPSSPAASLADKSGVSATASVKIPYVPVDVPT